MEELSFDFVELDSVDKSQHEFLLVASRSEQLNTYISLVNASGLKIKIIDVETYALMRAGDFPFHNMRLAPHIDKTALQDMAPRLLLACGLALRSVP